METLLLIIALAGVFVVLVLSAELWHQLRASRDRAARVEALRTLAFSEDPAMPAFASPAVAHAAPLVDDLAATGVANEIAAVPMFAAAMEPPAPARRWYVLAALFGVLGVVAGMVYALW